jgi:hypothetical protein
LIITSQRATYQGKLEGQLFALSRPYLEPSAYIESIHNNQADIQYTLRNVGRVKAENIRVVYITPEIKGAQLNMPQRQDLAPAGVMSLFLGPKALLRLTLTPPVLHIKIHLSYSAIDVSGKTWNFKSRFDFVLETDKAKTGELRYANASHEEGPLSDEDAQKLMGLVAQLDQEEGSFLSWMKLPEQNGPIGILLESKTKILFFDPTKRTLTFIQKNTNRSLSYNIPPQKSPWHNIGLTWTSTKISLYVNGNEAGTLP